MTLKIEHTLGESTRVSEWSENSFICNGNRTEWSPIRSVIIEVIEKDHLGDWSPEEDCC